MSLSQVKSGGGPFGPMDPSRECGACTACCVALGIADPQLQKPIGMPCQHLSGSGCGIYERRPGTCREWQCAWKWSSLIPSDLRPDKLGVMFFFETQTPPRFVTEHGYFMGRTLTDASAFNTPAMQRVLDGLVKRYPFVPIWLSAGEQKVCVYPQPPLQQVIEGQLKDPRLMPDAIRWIEGYVPFANASVGEDSWFKDDSWRARYPAPSPTAPLFGGPLRFT